MSIPGDSTLRAVRALEDDFAEAMSRMYVVGNELARLREQLSREASPQAWTPVPDTTGAVTAPPPAPVGTAPSPALTPASPPPASRPPATPWWQREGMVARLLAVVGTGITLIGVAFLLALAIQMGFFGPLARVLSGALLALALLGAALVVRRRQAGTAGSLGLAATGIATGYLDVVAVTLVHAWVPLPVGLALAAVVAAAGLLLARAWRSELLAVVTVLGVAVLAPVVGADAMLLVGQFLLVLTIATWPAQISHRWHVLETVRVVPTTLVLLPLALLDGARVTVTVMACLLLLVVLVTSVAGVRTARLPVQAGPLVAVAALPALGAAVVADRWPGTALAVALTAALVLTAVVGRAKGADGTSRVGALQLVPSCLAAAGAASLLAAGILAQGSDWFPAAALLVGVVWAVAALGLRHRTVTGVALATAALPLIAGVALVPYALDRGLADRVGPAQLAAAVLALVLLALLARAVSVALPALAPLLPRAFLAVALVAAGGSVVLAGTLLGALVDAPRGGFTAGQTGATVLWLATAAVLLLRGLRGHDGSAVIVPAGLAITACSIGKLLFFDLAFLDGVPRVLSFIVGGLIVLGTGAGCAQALERSRRQRGPVDNSGHGSGPAPTV